MADLGDQIAPRPPLSPPGRGLYPPLPPAEEGPGVRAGTATTWERPGRALHAPPAEVRALVRACWLPVLVWGIGINLLFLYGRERLHFLVEGAGFLPYLLVLALALRWRETLVSLARRAMEKVGRGWVPLILSLFVATTSLIWWLVLDGMLHIQDEIVHDFQARTYATGHLTLAPHPEPQFFAYTYIYHFGRWFGVNPPGWPLVLAIGIRAGIPWLVNPLLGAAALYLLYRIGRELVGLRMGQVWMALAALSPFLVFMSSSFMSHTASLVAFLLVVWGTVRLERSGGWRWAFLVGAGWGWAISIHLLDGLAAPLPFAAYAIYLVLRGRLRWTRLLPIAGLVLAFIGGLLIYNRLTTGDFFLFPSKAYYDITEPIPNCFRLGFGPDVGCPYEHGEPWPGFTPLLATWVTAQRLAQFLFDFFGTPFFLLLALPVWLRRQANRWDFLFVASGLAVIVAYFFFYFEGNAFGARYYFLLMPGALWLVVRSVRTLSPPFRAWGWAAVAAAVVGSLLIYTPYLVGKYRDNYWDVSPALYRAVDKVVKGPALIFIEGPRPFYGPGFARNCIPLASCPVIYARDWGADNARLMAYYPDRQPYLYTLQGQLLPLARP